MHHRVRYALFELYSNMYFSRITPSEEPIDVVILVIRKDLDVLPFCIEGIKQNVRNIIKDIYIVAPIDEQIIQFCKECNLRYIDEKTVLNISPQDINLTIKNRDGSTSDRSGWLFQQLIKLSAKIGSTDNYLTVDSDHIFIKPITFLSDKGIPVFYKSREHTIPYFDFIKRLLGIDFNPTFSFVAHKMLFNKKNAT